MPWANISVGACQSLESVDVVCAGLLWSSTLLVCLVAILKILEHLAALWAAHLVGGSTEVSREERAERWNSSCTSHEAWNLVWVRWEECDWGVDLESLHFWVQKEASGVDVATLESVSGNKLGMRVILIGVVILGVLTVLTYKQAT